MGIRQSYKEKEKELWHIDTALFVVMMKIQCNIQNTPRGRILFLSDGKTEVGCALDFGIRVTHLSVAGMDNIFYEQSDDLKDGLFTQKGWRLYGGHRIWNTPDSETCNYPDNDAVSYLLTGDGVVLTQKEEKWRQIEKTLELGFLLDGKIKVVNKVKNKGDKKLITAAWGINTLCGGHIEIDILPAETEGRAPGRSIALFGQTSPIDPRLRWEDKKLTAVFKPKGTEMKIGLYTASGKAVCTNKGQRFLLSFGAEYFGEYPDLNSNVEVYMNHSFIEIETLGKRVLLNSGQSVEHIEYWQVEPQESCQETT